MSEEPTENLSDRDSFESRVLAELAALGARMSALEDKVDARLRETRPILEAVLARVEVIDSKLDILNNDMLDMRGEVNLLKKRQPPAA